MDGHNTYAGGADALPGTGDYRYAGRAHLSKRGQRTSKFIDMEYVYQQIDRGRTVKDLAEELGVSRSTIRRRHIQYQEEARAVGAGKEEYPDPFDRLQG